MHILTANSSFPDEPLDLPPESGPEGSPLEGAAEQSALAWIAANGVENDTLPTDLADQHDHCLYDRPKKDRPR
jgi:hypothetical protein